MTHSLVAKGALAAALFTCLMPWVVTAQDVVNSPYRVTSGAVNRRVSASLRTAGNIPQRVM